MQKLNAARLAADVMGVPTLLLARTDAEAADLVTSDIDERDRPFLTGERTAEGFYRTKKGFEQALARGLAYATVADMVCRITSYNVCYTKLLRGNCLRMPSAKRLANSRSGVPVSPHTMSATVA